VSVRQLLLALGIVLLLGGVAVTVVASLRSEPVASTPTSIVATTSPALGEAIPGTSDIQSGDLAAAQSKLEAHLEANPQDKQARYLLALVHERGLDWDGAMQVYADILELDARDFEAHFRIANLYRRLEQPEEAAASFEESLRLNSDFTAARVALAETVAGLGDADRAIRLYFEVIEMRPMGVQFDQIRVALAEQLVAVDQADNAALQLEKALAENPDNAEARALLDELRGTSTTTTQPGADGTTSTTVAN